MHLFLRPVSPYERKYPGTSPIEILNVIQVEEEEIFFDPAHDRWRGRRVCPAKNAFISKCDAKRRSRMKIAKLG
jgi:hypothetical protein